MKSMYRGDRPFDREQLVFVVEVMVVSFVEMLTCTFPGRWIDGHREEQYRKERTEVHRDAQDTIEMALWQLGWNLSILYAQLTGDGMGEFDALAIGHLGDELRSWAENWASGEKGFLPDGKGSGKAQTPDTRSLAEAWVGEVFGDYLIGR